MIVEAAAPQGDANRVKQLRGEIEASDSGGTAKLQEQVAKLAGGVAVIKVGAATETALKERKHRVRGRGGGGKAAVEEGIVPGGGSALVQARAVLKPLRDSLSGDELSASTSSLTPLAAPLYWIATNAGLDGSVVVQGRRTAGPATASTRRRCPTATWWRRHHRPVKGDPFSCAQRRIGGAHGP